MGNINALEIQGPCKRLRENAVAYAPTGRTQDYVIAWATTYYRDFILWAANELGIEIVRERFGRGRYSKKIVGESVRLLSVK